MIKYMMILVVVLVVGLSLSLTIGVQADHPKDAAVLNCEIDGSVFDVRAFSSTFLTPPNCDTDDDCAACIAEVLDEGLDLKAVTTGGGSNAQQTYSFTNDRR